jgi:hypothetical protein
MWKSAVHREESGSSIVGSVELPTQKKLHRSPHLMPSCRRSAELLIDRGNVGTVTESGRRKLHVKIMCNGGEEEMR